MPGLSFGQKRATALMQESGGVLLSAFIKTREQLETVPGIGKEIANRFRIFLDR